MNAYEIEARMVYFAGNCDPYLSALIILINALYKSINPLTFTFTLSTVRYAAVDDCLTG